MKKILLILFILTNSQFALADKGECINNTTIKGKEIWIDLDTKFKNNPHFSEICWSCPNNPVDLTKPIGDPFINNQEKIDNCLKSKDNENFEVKVRLRKSENYGNFYYKGDGEQYKRMNQSFNLVLIYKYKGRDHEFILKESIWPFDNDFWRDERIVQNFKKRDRDCGFTIYFFDIDPLSEGREVIIKSDACFRGRPTTSVFLINNETVKEAEGYYPHNYEKDSDIFLEFPTNSIFFELGDHWDSGRWHGCLTDNISNIDFIDTNNDGFLEIAYTENECILYHNLNDYPEGIKFDFIRFVSLSVKDGVIINQSNYVTRLEITENYKDKNKQNIINLTTRESIKDYMSALEEN